MSESKVFFFKISRIFSLLFHNPIFLRNKSFSSEECPSSSVKALNKPAALSLRHEHRGAARSSASCICAPIAKDTSKLLNVMASEAGEVG